MTRWLLLAVLIFAGCKDVQVRPAATAEVTPDLSPTVDSWAHVTSANVKISIKTPPGWQAISNEYGILLAEHADLVQSDTAEGLLIYCFVPEMDHITYPKPASTNLAWSVLNHIARLPSYTGTASVTDTTAFDWDNHDAAYYLLSDKDGSRTIVVAVALTGQTKLVVCNASTTAKDADRIRKLLPDVLDTLTVNDERMDTSALRKLPDPLVFPDYVMPEITATAEASPGA